MCALGTLSRPAAGSCRALCAGSRCAHPHGAVAGRGAPRRCSGSCGSSAPARASAEEEAARLPGQRRGASGRQAAQWRAQRRADLRKAPVAAQSRFQVAHSQLVVPAVVGGHAAGVEAGRRGCKGPSSGSRSGCWLSGGPHHSGGGSSSQGSSSGGGAQMRLPRPPWRTRAGRPRSRSKPAPGVRVASRLLWRRSGRPAASRLPCEPQVTRGARRTERRRPARTAALKGTPAPLLLPPEPPRACSPALGARPAGSGRSFRRQEADTLVSAREPAHWGPAKEGPGRPA